MNNFIKAFVIFLFCQNLYATSLLEYLNSKDRTYKNFGHVMEQIAQLYIECKYKDHNGIYNVYYYYAGSVKGELDIVVMKDNVAYMVIEVKAWKNVGRSLIRARSQLSRFIYYISMDKDMTFSKYVQMGAFSRSTQYKTLSYFGTTLRGFDIEVPVRYIELRFLHKKLISIMRKLITEEIDYCSLVDRLNEVYLKQGSLWNSSQRRRRILGIAQFERNVKDAMKDG